MFRYIEHELYSYDATKKEIEELREDIILSSPPREVVVIGDAAYGDAVSPKALKLASSLVLARMVRVVAAIDRALARLEGHHRQLFELKYRRGKSWQEICQEMHIEERTYYKYRKELVVTVASELGLVNRA